VSERIIVRAETTGKLYITADGLSDAPGEEPAGENVEICINWLEEFAEPREGFGTRSSYALKHDVEEWAGEYVSNGSFIQAAHQLGYDVKRLGDGPNAVFNISVDPRGLRAMLGRDDFVGCSDQAWSNGPSAREKLRFCVDQLCQAEEFKADVGWGTEIVPGLTVEELIGAVLHAEHVLTEEIEEEIEEDSEKP
jgi:hypothetical protein